MTKKIIKKKKLNVTKKYQMQEAKQLAISIIQNTVDGSRELKELAEKQFPHMSGGEVVNEKALKNITRVSLAYSQESGYALLESLDPDYRGFALQLRINMQKEFNCKTSSEIALIDQAVGAHIRGIINSKLLEERNEQSVINKQKVSLLKFYSKEIDRAHRQFISTIETLKFMKQPSLKVSVKTNNAFISENQQFNNNVKNNEAK